MRKFDPTDKVEAPWVLEKSMQLFSYRYKWCNDDICNLHTKGSRLVTINATRYMRLMKCNEGLPNHVYSGDPNSVSMNCPSLSLAAETQASTLQEDL